MTRAMFHLFTHAFFKALLFLSAGAVIMSMHHEQDMRKMGGLWKAIPFTWAMMLIGNLALTGVGIPLSRHRRGRFLFQGRHHQRHLLRPHRHRHLCLHAAADRGAMTSFYSWRQFLMTFHGRYRGAQMRTQHVDHGDTHAWRRRHGHDSIALVRSP